jgi:hypothetical protein
MIEVALDGAVATAQVDKRGFCSRAIKNRSPATQGFCVPER